MKVSNVLFAIVLICLLPLAFLLTVDRSIAGSSQDKKQPEGVDARFTLGQLQADFKQLRNAMGRHHPAMYAHTSKAEFDRLFDSQYAALEDSMGLEDTFRVFSSLVARIGCGHSSVWMPAGYWDGLPGRLFPLKMRFVGDKAYVYDSYSTEDSFPAGSEIRSLNGKPMQAVLSELKTVISADAFSNTYKNYRLGLRFPLIYSLFYGHPNEFNVTFRRPGKQDAETRAIKPVPTDLVWGHMGGPERLDLELRDELNTAILTIGSFAYYRDHEKFFTFVDDAFERIANSQVKNLILDLRQNDGGDPFCASHLFAYLEQEPVPYFARPYGKYARLAKPIPLADNHFSGTLFILINGGGASTTGHFSGLLKFHSQGTFIGEETGATFFCHDAHLSMTLKHTGFQVGIARQTFSAAVRGLPKGRGIIPDFEVPLNPVDLAADRDTVLEFALGMCRK